MCNACEIRLISFHSLKESVRIVLPKRLIHDSDLNYDLKIGMKNTYPTRVYKTTIYIRT